MTPAALMILRLLLVADGIIMAAVGIISLLFVDRPAGLVFTAGAWFLSLLLFGGVPFTDPHRGDPW
jgi:hypothetical protein